MKGPHMEHNHRSLGRELRLFDTKPIVGAGLPLWYPAGAVIRSELEQLALEQALDSGCSRIYTPVLAKRELFEKSGHWDKFSADMFPEMLIGEESFVLRPANCPHHTQVYAAEGRSYRDLPIRLAELGSMFRSELSGNLGGLSRVRQINLDDAHSFCCEDQVGAEVLLALRAIRRSYDILGIEIAYYRLSLRGAESDAGDGGFVGSDGQWQRAEFHLREALAEFGAPYVDAPGEAAFYGPKIDVQVIDANGKEETLSTVQVDYNQPERFNLQYADEQGKKVRPVMIHRGLLSSMERMTALLIERYDGRLPTWLAPVQVRVLPVSAVRHGQAAHAAWEELRAAGIRAEISDRGSLGSRIRDSRASRDPYQAIIGDEETMDRSVSVNAPGIGATEKLPLAEFTQRMRVEIHDRRIEPSVVG